MAHYVVATGVADVRREADEESERVTQALMNMPVYSEETRDDWVKVKLVDYMGWIRLRDLAEPVQKGFCMVGAHCGTALALVAVVTAPSTLIYEGADDQQPVDTLYCSTQLLPVDLTHPRRVQVALPDERVGWLERASIELREQKEPYPRQSVETVADLARGFLDVPYLWGGTSHAGIDCSGFVQLCYRMGGYFIPRDADQQDGFLYHEVARTHMRTGDLIFFGSQKITHVGMALNEREYIHAEGQRYNRVTINSFSSSDQHYYPRLDEIVWSLKRVVG